jgi:dihydropyrimidinase
MSSQTLCLSGGILLGSRRREPVDILIDGQTIVDVGSAGTLSAATMVDVAGSWVIPGIIDAHVHPIHAETFESVGDLAASSGVTTVLHHLYPQVDESLTAAVSRGFLHARSAASDFGFHVRLTPDRLDEPGRPAGGLSLADRLKELASRSEVVAVKAFLAHSDPTVAVGFGELTQIMFAAHASELPVVVHAEPGDVLRNLEQLIGPAESLQEHSALRSADLEAATVDMAAAIANSLGARVYIAHISSALAAEAAYTARARGTRIKGETCAHYLFLDSGSDLGPLGRVAPPLRDVDSMAALRELTGNTSSAIDVIASDHCGYLATEKSQDDFAHAGNGISGIESLVPLLIDSLAQDYWLSPDSMIRLCCEGPATVFGLERKGRIATGYDADLVVVDPTGTTSLLNPSYRSEFADTPYRDRKLKGSISHVLRRGEFAVRDGTNKGLSGARPVQRKTPEW